MSDSIWDEGWSNERIDLEVALIMETCSPDIEALEIAFTDLLKEMRDEYELLKSQGEKNE